jgi:hypothetical protein
MSDVEACSFDGLVLTGEHRSTREKKDVLLPLYPPYWIKNTVSSSSFFLTKREGLVWMTRKSRPPRETPNTAILQIVTQVTV